MLIAEANNKNEEDPMDLSKYYRKITLVKPEEPKDDFELIAEIIENKIKASITNNTDDSKDLMLILAIYNKDGDLLKYESKNTFTAVK